MLDTNIIIDFLNGNEKTAAVLRELNDAQWGTSIFNKYEIVRGQSGDSASKTDAFIKTLNVYQFTEQAMVEAAGLYKKLKTKKIKTDKMEIDILIAGIAISNREKLLTADQDFKEIDSEYIVVLEK